MSDYPMLISNKLHSFRNFTLQRYKTYRYIAINSHFLSYWIAVILRTVLALFSSFSNKLLWCSIKQRNKKEAICSK